MKLLGEKLVPNQPGTITIIPEKTDDLWVLFNLIANDDVVSACTTRKIQFCSDSTNKDSNSRVQLEVEIKVEAVDYEKDCSIIRVHGKTITSNDYGKTITSNDYVKCGFFHTLELGTKKEFNLNKKLWDEVTIRVLMDSSQNGTTYNLGVILIKDRSAEISLIDENAASSVTPCATIRCEKSSKNRDKFFDNLFVSFLRHIDMDVIPYVVIASNNALKDDFRAYLLLEAKRWSIKSIESNKSRILTVNKSSVKDILSDKMVMNVTKSTSKSEINTKVLEKFMHMVITKCDRVCYGCKSVEYAHELLAIDTLLITDEILKNKDIKLRKKYLALKKSVHEAGGKVLQFNDTDTEGGERLAQLTGIAAILRFPIPNLDDLIL